VRPGICRIATRGHRACRRHRCLRRRRPAPRLQRSSRRKKTHSRRKSARSVAQQVVAPVDQRTQRPLAGKGGTRSTRQQAEYAVEPVVYFFH
jgi:hypothetical protein